MQNITHQFSFSHKIKTRKTISSYKKYFAQTNKSAVLTIRISKTILTFILGTRKIVLLLPNLQKTLLF